MSPEDYVSLISLVRQELERIGLAELGYPDRYLAEEGGYALSPEEQLKQMLKAFDRHIAVSDRRVYQTAIGEIRSVLTDGSFPDSVEIEFDPRTIAETGPELQPMVLSPPDLRSVRDRLKKLILELSNPEKSSDTSEDG